LIVSFVIAILLGGPFYLSLYNRFGRFTAFNREPLDSNKLLLNQPLEFYLSLDLDKLFTEPVRPAFPNHLIPLFYSDMWGDYWGFFFSPRFDRPEAVEKHGHPESIKKYLGRVNLMSLIPTFIMFAGICLGFHELIYDLFKREKQNSLFGLLVLIILCSTLGYLWFLVSYPNPGKGDTIKATYMLYIFPFIAILSAELFERLYCKNRYLYYILLALLFCITFHNIPTMITYYKHQILPL